MEQIRSGELLHKAILKQKEEKRKLRKLKKEQTFDPHDRNIESKYIYILSIYFLAYFSWLKASIIYFTCMLAIKSSDETETETEAWNEETAMSTTTVPTEPFYMV